MMYCKTILYLYIKKAVDYNILSRSDWLSNGQLCHCPTTIITGDSQILYTIFTSQYIGMAPYQIAILLSLGLIKVGSVGLRYTCMVSGKQAYLFFEDNKWFIEAK